MGKYTQNQFYSGIFALQVEYSPEVRALQKKYPAEATKAAKTALKRLRAPVRLETKKLVRSLYGIAASDSELNDAVSASSSFDFSEDAGGITATKTFIGRRLSSYHFKGKGTRGGRGRPFASMAVFKGRRQSVKGGFMAQANGSPLLIFKRTGQKSKKNPKKDGIKAVRSVAVVQMIQHPDVRKPLEQVIGKKFQENFMKEMSKRLGG